MEFTREDIVSERFIHTCLLEEAEAMVGYLPEAWRESKGHLPHIGVTWPATDIKGTDGHNKKRIISFFSDDDAGKRVNELLRFVGKTNAYALLVIDQHPKHIKVIFESMHGTRSWTLRIEQHGDSKVLSKPTVSDNKESVGLLWKDKVGTA